MTQQFNEELTFREALFKRLDSQDKSLLEIKEQTTKTNGSVRKLQMWKAYILGLMAGGTIILGLVVYVWNLKIGSIERVINNVEQKLEKHVATN